MTVVVLPWMRGGHLPSAIASMVSATALRATHMASWRSVK